MDTYASLAGTELWNSERLRAYLEAGYGPPGVDVNACGACDGMPVGPCDAEGNPTRPVYTRPDDPDNPAPWYDPADPSSADFAGLLVLEVNGWETAQYERSVQNRISGGAFLGRGRYAPRTITVEALLIGRTCCSLSTGLKWLQKALVNPCYSCGGDELDYFECCPGQAGACGKPGLPAEEQDWDRHRRTLRDVGLTAGVEVTEKLGRACGQCASGCSFMRVQFTLTAGDPYSYGEKICYVEDRPIAGEEGEDPDENGCEITWVQKDECEERDPCYAPGCPNSDPRCPTPPLPPQFPVPNGCGCEPLSKTGSCVLVEPDDVPDNQELVPFIEIYAGSLPLRGVKVQFFNNPRSLPRSELSECDVCAEFVVSYLEPGSTFTLDGQQRKFLVTCPGREPANGARLITGRSGYPFEWPSLTCGGGYTVCVSADSASVAPDATYDVCAFPRSAA